MTDKGKILQYLDYKGINKNKFYNKTGLSKGFLDKGNSLGVDKLRIIVDNYRDLNPVWIVTGNGDMLLSENTNSPTKSEMVDKMDLTKDPRLNVLSGSPERSLEYYEKFMQEQADMIDEYQGKEKEFLQLMKQQGNSVERLIVLVEKYKQEIIELRSKLNTDQSIG